MTNPQTEPYLGPRFILFDGRAKAGDIDDALEMDTAETTREAWRAGSRTWKDHDAIWYDTKRSELRYDLPPNRPERSFPKKSSKR